MPELKGAAISTEIPRRSQSGMNVSSAV